MEYIILHGAQLSVILNIQSRVERSGLIDLVFFPMVTLGQMSPVVSPSLLGARCTCMVASTTV